jgi:hypothetical protein
MPRQLLTLPSSHTVRRSSLASAAALALMLGACGGSDEVPLGSAPVITTQPADMNLAEGASGTVSVAATSDAGAIAYQWFNVTRAENIAGALAADLDFGPVSFAANGTQFNARLTNTMGTTTSATRTLTVAERTWSAPADAMASGARQLATVVDSNGHTHLLAVTGNNLAAGVQASIQLRSASPTQANGFTAPGNAVLQASEALAAGGTSVAAAANGAGNVLAVWHRNGIVGGALYTPGPNATTAGAWTLLPTRINSFSATSALDPAVAAVGNNSFEIVWRERIANTGAHDVMARTYTVGTNTLGTAVSIESQTSETEAPQIVSDSTGNVLAAWRHVGQGVMINRRIANTAWTTDLVNVDSSGLPLEALRANAAGKAVLLTSNRLGTVNASRLDMAATTVFLANDPGIANAYGSGPDAVVDNTDRIHVFGVSCCGSGGSSRVYRWIYQNGLWTAAEAISDANANNFLTTGLGFYSPRVSAVDAENSFIVTWQDLVSNGDNALSHVSARRFHTPLSVWRPAVVVGDGNDKPVRVTMGSNGKATLVVGASSGQALQAASFR